MTQQRRIPLLLSALAASALLAACGGGSTANTAAAEQAVITGRAVDGPLAGATACYDLNDNGACDSTEPVSAATTADGSFRISVALADAGRHAVVVDVPPTAVDADTQAAVGTAFTLRAPATGSGSSHAVFVSPLTTLVHAHMAYSGVSLDAARDFVQGQANTGFSPLVDFTQDNTTAAKQTALLARLVQLTANEQRVLLDGVAGSNALDGGTITAADVDREVFKSLASGLPLLAGALTDPGLASAQGGLLQSLLRVAARASALQLDLTADGVRMASTLKRLAEPPTPATPVATGALRFLSYTTADSWRYRMLQASAEDNVADASGYVRYYDWTLRSTPNATTGRSVTSGSVTTGTTVAPHWNGTAWVTRAANGRSLSKVRDTQGRSDYDHADGLEVGTSIRGVDDISGLSMQSVVQLRIRRFPGSSNGVAFANWGPSNLALYGTTTFPAGSYLIYQSDTPTRTAISYGPNSRVQAYSAAVSAGGDARSTPGLACADPAQNTVLTPVGTLDQLRAAYLGRRCTLNPEGGTPNFSLSPNENWQAAVLVLGYLDNTNTLPAGTGNFYDTVAVLGVSFGAGNRVTFWRCYEATNDGTARNCTVLGLGTWSVQTLGDARVLGFSTAPALVQRLGAASYFVERGGSVFYGSKAPVGVTTTDLRLNLTAANAVFQQLSLPRVKPITQPGSATGTRAASLTTLQGTWGGATTTEANVWRFGPNGRFFMAEAKPFDAVFREQSGAELGWFDVDPTAGFFSSLVEVDSNLTSGTSHPQPSEMFLPLTVTPTQLTLGSGSNAFVLNRLPTVTSGTSVVGMWAFNSANDLSVPHAVFFSNGRAMLITHRSDATCPGTNQCPPGVEFSEYSFDTATNTLTVFNLLYDTNGCDGSFNSCAARTLNTTSTANLVIAADGRTAVLTDQNGLQFTLFRIQPQ